MTQEEISEALAAHALWLDDEAGGKKMVAVNADMIGANLSGTNLSRADISRAYMSWATMSGADMTYAYISGARLRCADMRVVDLRGADMSEADISWADMTGTRLRWADMTETNLSGTRLRRADMTGADMSEADISTAYFDGTLLDVVQWTPGLALCGRAHRGDHEFFAWLGAWPGAEPVIRAGCRTWIGFADAREHYNAMQNRAKAEHSLVILDYLERCVDAQRKQWSR
jgi:hypothetical protein